MAAPDADEVALREAFVDCARYGETEDVAAALEERPDLADVARDARGNSALHMASANGHADVVRLLLRAAPAAVRAQNASGSTPLHWAVMGGSADVVGLLLAAGADPAAKDAQGKSPVDVAERLERTKISVLLLKAVQLPPSQPEEETAEDIAAAAEQEDVQEQEQKKKS